MKKIQLTQNKYALVDYEDYEKINKYNWQVSKNKRSYYATRKNKNKSRIIMHRILINCPENLQVDHINGNGLDNRKENLRICTTSQNAKNKRLNKNNTSGFKGVIWCKHHKKWLARICVDRKLKFLGYFIKINDAKEAYIKASKQYHKEFSNCGIIKEDKELQKEIDKIKLNTIKKVRIDSKSGIRCVYYHKRDKKWRVRITINKKLKVLGYFNTKEEAALSYKNYFKNKK